MMLMPTFQGSALKKIPMTFVASFIHHGGLAGPDNIAMPGSQAGDLLLIHNGFSMSGTPTIAGFNRVGRMYYRVADATDTFSYTYAPSSSYTDPKGVAITLRPSRPITSVIASAPAQTVAEQIAGAVVLVGTRFVDATVQASPGDAGQYDAFRWISNNWGWLCCKTYAGKSLPFTFNAAHIRALLLVN